MLIGDFGTSWTKILDLSKGKYRILPSLESRKLRVDIATGHNAGLHSGSTLGELSALVMGGLRLIGKDFLLLDIGGRDMKFVEARRGKVRRMEWNTQCGAMTGFTLEIVGRYFDLGFDNIDPADKGYPMTCGVLGVERAFDDLAQGADKKEALARLAKGIAEAAHKFIGSPQKFFLSGGMCENKLFLSSFPAGIEVIPLGRFVLVEGLRSEAEKIIDHPKLRRGRKKK